MDFLPNDRTKFRIATVVIALFFLLDITLLASTFLLSDEVKANATTINLAGRQRMLSQRMVKCLLHLEQNQSVAQQQSTLQELALTFRLFDTTLQAFSQGGSVEGKYNKHIVINPLTETANKELVSQAEILWKPYRTSVVALLSEPGKLPVTIKPAIAMAHQYNLELLRLMDALTSELEETTIRKTQQLHLMQSIMMGLALTSFCIMMLLMRKELLHSKRRSRALDQIIHTINAAILVYDSHGIIRAANKPAAAIFGYPDNIEMTGMAHHHLLFQRGNDQLGRRQDGSTFYATSQCSEFPIDNVNLKLETIVDISLQRSVEESLSKLAYYDALTGLPNRLLFEDRLHQGIFASKRQNHKLAVLFVDLDKFKQVNDVHGHHIGDLLLKEIADRLRLQLREEDTICRVGGDEFVILLSSVASVADCEHIITKLLEALWQPFEAESIQLQPGASIGACIYPDHGEDEASILKKADQAMYLAKRDEKRHFAFYSEIISEDSNRQ